MNIKQHFFNHFEVIDCRSEATIISCMRLRYQAYCVENHYPMPKSSIPAIESDEFDWRSQHALIRHNQSGLDVATVRLILCNVSDPLEKYPIEHFDILRRFDRDQAWKVSRCSVAEVSRFAVSKEFRKRVEEQDVTHGITPRLIDDHISEHRRTVDITLGLFYAVVKMSHENGITHWYALMEPSLIRLLGMSGIRFTAVGPAIDHFGIRQPCIAAVHDVLAGIYHFRKENWAFITDEGKLYGVDYLEQPDFAPAMLA